MKRLQLTSLLFTVMGALTLSACGPEEQNLPDLKPLKDMAQPVIDSKTPEYFMTYHINGKKVSLDKAIVKLSGRDVRYSLFGDNDEQGDIAAVLVQHLHGPPRVGNFSTDERGLIFTLRFLNKETQLWESWSTLDMMKLSYGTGTLSYTEVTDTYVRGTFSFVATFGEEDGPAGHYEVTQGRFKARIMKF